MNTLQRYNQDKFNPVEYDLLALTYLKNKYGGAIRSVIRELKKVKYDFKSMNVLHSDSIDPELIFRQTIPMCVTNSTFFKSQSEIVPLIKSFCLCKTLTLNNIDSHLDRNIYETSHKYKYLTKHFESAACFSLTSISNGVLNILELKNFERILGRIFKTMQYLSQSMYEDYANRYKRKQFSNIHSRLKHYKTSHRSRLLGSGFYDAGIMSVFEFYGTKPPGFLKPLILNMRKLRQLSDELSDINADLLSGLITYPVLKLLSCEPGCSKDIRKLWKITESLQKNMDTLNNYNLSVHSNPLVKEILDYIYCKLIKNNVQENVFNEAKSLTKKCMGILTKNLNDKGFDFSVIIDLKSAFLDRLKMYKWVDKRPEYKIF